MRPVPFNGTLRWIQGQPDNIANPIAPARRITERRGIPIANLAKNW
jgi:hypothetical protein